MRAIDVDELQKVIPGSEVLVEGFKAESVFGVPVVEAEPVRYGEWEERIVECDNPFFRLRFYCSNCGDWNTHGMTRYCPECGAKMAVKK